MCSGRCVGPPPAARGWCSSTLGASRPRLRRGSLPGTLLPQSILDSEKPVRALIVIAGNPLLSTAGEQQLRKAFEQLDLLVVIDIYPNATSELAHVLLPSTDMYERDDLNIVNIGTSAAPFAQYTPAVVAPKAERQPEWWIVHSLLQTMGKPSLFDDLPEGEQPDPWAKWRHMLESGSGLQLADLQADGAPRVLPAPGSFFDDQVHTAHGEIAANIEIDDDLMAGVVSMVHGWGHTASPRLRVAAAHPGSNPNALLPIGPNSFEPLSSQAHMTGIPVTVLARRLSPAG